MRAQSGSTSRNYYVCVTRLQRTGSCSQPGIVAEHIEAQLFDLLQQVKLPPDWQYQVLRELGQDPDEIERKREEIKRRLERATELYLAGLITKGRLADENRKCQFNLSDLTGSSIGSIVIAENQLRAIQDHGSELKNIEKRKLLQGLVAAVFAQGDTLKAIQFTEAMYPLIKQAFDEACFYSGSDGT